MFMQLMGAFNHARKTGSVDKNANQTKFNLTFDDLNIHDVPLILYKKAVNNRSSVNVLMNDFDKRSIIFPDEEIDKARAILAVCLPVAEYDIVGHASRELQRKAIIEKVENEIRTNHFEQMITNTNAPAEIVDELRRQIKTSKAMTCYRNCEELRRYAVDFNDMQKVNSFTYTLYASACMITEFFAKTTAPNGNIKIGKLPSEYFFYYVYYKDTEHTPPRHIVQTKKMLHGLYKFYNNPFKFYCFCEWLVSLFSKIPGNDREVMLTVEKIRYNDRQERLRIRKDTMRVRKDVVTNNGDQTETSNEVEPTNQYAPSDKEINHRRKFNKKWNDRGDDDFDSKSGHRAKAKRAQMRESNVPSGLGSLSEAFDQLDFKLPDGE